MANLGKIFEDNWRLSVPDDIFFYRFRDSSGGWNGSTKTRFTPSNIADCLLEVPFVGLILAELKSHKGRSIPLSCIAGNKTKEKQMEDLAKANKFASVYSCIIVFFSDLERCFELGIDEYFLFLATTDRKSIPIEYFEEHGIEIKVEKLRTNYRYDIDSWLKEF